MVGPTSTSRAPWSGSTWLKGLAVGGWLVGCDAWVKITARAGTCPDTSSIGEAVGLVWNVPPGCTEADLWGFAQLSPAVRDGGPLGLGAGLLGASAGQGWAIALLAMAAIVSVLVFRWQWRSVGDASALGALWGGVVILAGPRLVGDGTGMAELHLGEMATGLGDLALLWALVWLGWRLFAELRA